MTQMPAVFTVVAAVLNSRANEGTDGLYRPAGSVHETAADLIKPTELPLVWMIEVYQFPFDYLKPDNEKPLGNPYKELAWPAVSTSLAATPFASTLALTTTTVSTSISTTAVSTSAITASITSSSIAAAIASSSIAAAIASISTAVATTIASALPTTFTATLPTTTLHVLRRGQEAWPCTEGVASLAVFTPRVLVNLVTFPYSIFLKVVFKRAYFQKQ